MARAKLDEDAGRNGVATAVHPALAVSRAETARRRGAQDAPDVPQEPLPSFASNKADRKGKDKAPKKAAPGGPKKPAPAAKPEPAGAAGRVPTKAELLDATAKLRAFRDAARAAEPVLQRMLAETWPVADESREGRHLYDQVKNLVDTEYEVAAASTIDMSLGTTVEEVEVIIEALEGKGAAGDWAAEVLSPGKSAPARPSGRAPRPKLAEPEPEEDDEPAVSIVRVPEDEIGENGRIEALDDDEDDDEPEEDEDDFLDDESDGL